MSNQFSILNGHNRQRFGGPGSVNGSEDGFGPGCRRALGGRMSGRMQMRPSLMNDPASGDGGDGHAKKCCTERVSLNRYNIFRLPLQLPPVVLDAEAALLRGPHRRTERRVRGPPVALPRDLRAPYLRPAHQPRRHRRRQSRHRKDRGHPPTRGE